MREVLNRATLNRWLQGDEDEHCEFKEARNSIDAHDVTEYCVALANEGGGHLVLGVTNRKPRRVVGSRACQNLQQEKRALLDRIHLRVDADEIDCDGKRVVVFSVPARPIGTPIQYRGRYLMRSGDALTSMTPERLQEIFAEAQPDFSAEICDGAKVSDLDGRAVRRFRSLWHRKSRIAALRAKWQNNCSEMQSFLTIVAESPLRP
jgi:ATP-dependent DNA helicase RecG